MKILPNKILFVTAIFVLTGCAHQLQFRVIDASSGHNLSAAGVSVKERGFFYYFDSDSNEKVVGLTDTNGLITVRGVDSSDVVLFNAHGFRGAAAGIIERGKVGISPFPPI